MSRVGKKPIAIPQSVKVNIKDSNIISVEGPKGNLSHTLPNIIAFKIENSNIILDMKSDTNSNRAIYGLTRTLINNLIIGVTQGFSKELEIQGVGFKAQSQGKKLSLALGFSHPVEYDIPEGIIIETPKPNQIIVKGIDKVKVGEISSRIRSFYRPEPYKGKGIRYVGEYVRKKAGKTVA
jgi:large subunit ribosomal protein L6